MSSQETGAVDLSDDFDQIAIVVDWLDACRKRELDALLELYAEGASVECCCGGTQRYQGLAALAAYWRPQFEAFVPTAFGLEEIAPTAEGVALDYLNFEGKPVRLFFTFTAEGKIWQTSCAPLGAADDGSTAQHPDG
jgi:SnoaL-like domain